MSAKVLLLLCLVQFAHAGIWFYVGQGCFGAKGNSFARITYNGPSAFVGAVKLVHVSGLVSNAVSYKGSYWGRGLAGDNRLGTVITDPQNTILYPRPRLTNANNPSGWYTIAGYTTFSSELVFADFCVPQFVNKGTRLRVWYSEDLKGYTESDNRGRSCMKMFAYLFQ